MANDLIIKAEDVFKSYNIDTEKPTHVLKGISLEITAGEFLAIVGPSGVGKSTFLYLLGSLDLPDRGSIQMYNNNTFSDFNSLSSVELSDLRNKKIGFVFQFHHLLPEFTALENIMIPAFIAGKTYSETIDKAKNLIKLVGVESRSDHKPMELSGGEQQRVAIARALINDPTIVLADEPTGNLDSKNSNIILELIQELRQKYSLTFVVATHNKEVSELAERIVVMEDGKIVS